MLFSFYLFKDSKAFVFALSFVFSHFVAASRGGTFHNKPSHNDFCTWGEDWLWFYMDFGMALFFYIQFLFSKSIVNVSLFAQLIIQLLVKLYLNCHNNQSKHKNRTLSI